MMRVDTRPRKRNSPRIAEKSAPGYLQWLRGRPCLFAFMGPCSGKIEAMHLDFAGGKGVATKVADKFAVPACTGHHSLQHVMGWLSFLTAAHTTKEALLGAAERLWIRWPSRAAWERKLEERENG